MKSSETKNLNLIVKVTVGWTFQPTAMSIDIDNAVTVGKNAYPTNSQVQNDGAVYAVVVGLFSPPQRRKGVDNAVMVGKNAHLQICRFRMTVRCIQLS